ncbi:SAM-dependent methyltransferase [Pontiella agarivorans]|uniref:Class I SAM-dependent methyltransferase n=1 Tax=Pontiella agarivorans TaxID=3038953 RepID=A0ABU5MVW7_9BACT|nr:class I SAM-dependent methyltransferase [Pontiella agarivorans]MDZ8118312.1 class I SAM-dependent methyltransferase [Pontiella agarivorans]
MWDKTYSTDEFVYGTEPNAFLKANTDKLKPGSVLCLGDGEGRNGVYLAKLGFEVTSVDLSETGLAKARELAEANNVEINTICADLNDYAEEPNCWDNIVSIFCHLPPPLRKKVHAASAEALTENGIFLLEAYTPRQLEMPGTGGPPVPELLYSAGMLKDDFQSLEVFQALETEREVNEGSKHYGPGAVVQLLARKT